MRIKRSLGRMREYPAAPTSRRGFVRLDMNENNYGCAPAVIRAMRRIVPADLAMYPEYRKTRELLAARHRLQPDNVCLAAGGDEAIRAVMQAFLETGDEIVIPRPTFAIYDLAAGLQGARIMPVQYGPDFVFPLAGVLGHIGGRSRMVVVVSPNNPTGTVIRRTGLIRILEKLADGLVILDHTYCLFGGGDFSSLVRRHENLVVIHSFSKSFGLAGLRLGYTLAAAETSSAIRRVLPPFSVNSLALTAAAAALASSRHLERTVKYIRQERTILLRELAAMGVRTWPSQASFLLARFGSRCERVLEKLRQQGILVRGFPGDPRLQGFCRITVGRPAENRRLLGALKKIVAARTSR